MTATEPNLALFNASPSTEHPPPRFRPWHYVVYQLDEGLPEEAEYADDGEFEELVDEEPEVEVIELSDDRDMALGTAQTLADQIDGDLGEYGVWDNHAGE